MAQIKKKLKLCHYTNPYLNLKKDHHNLKNMHGIISSKIKGKPLHFPLFKSGVKHIGYVLPHQINQKGF